MTLLGSIVRMGYAMVMLSPFIIKTIWGGKKNNTKTLAKALNRLGPSWVKLGQFMATRPDIVGVDIADSLRSLQDRMTPFKTKKAKEIVKDALGQEIETMFLSFSEPIAAASIAQVHKATIKDEMGNEKNVAVKIIRPNVRKRFKRDLKTFYQLAHIANFVMPKIQRLQLIPCLNVLEKSAIMEMDLRLEAAAINEMDENIKDDEQFKVPKVYWQYSKRDCLTVEWIEGIKFTDTKAMNTKLKKEDRVKLANAINQNFLRHTLRDGFFHADMHQGNLFVDENGVIVAVDMGIVGRLNKSEQKFLGEVLLGFITRDYNRIAQIHFEQGYVPDDQDAEAFAQALRAVGEPIHGQDSKQISMGNVLALLFEITELFNMKTQPRLLLLQKTMVVVEGVARSLDPQFNMWESAKPIVVPIMARMLGPIGAIEEMNESAKAIKNIVRMAPDMLQSANKIKKIIEQTIENNENKNNAQTKQYNRKNQWIGFTALAAVVAVIVMVNWK